MHLDCLALRTREGRLHERLVWSDPVVRVVMALENQDGDRGTEGGTELREDRGRRFKHLRR